MSKRLWLALLLAGVVAAPAMAVPISITNTGINLIGGLDQSWDVGLTDAPAPQPTSTANVDAKEITSGPFGGGLWLANTALSHWIGPTGPDANSPLASSSTYFSYSTTFNLTGTTNAQLTGRYASDNQTFAIYLNNTLIPGFVTNCADSVADLSCFNSWEPFSVSNSSLFQVGSNSLEFVVFNLTGPSGFRAEITGSFDESAPIPEPGTLLLLGSGLTALAMRRRRRTQ